MTQLMFKCFAKGSGKTVYDIGSMDVNGTHKPIVEGLGLPYVGVDIATGKNVDLVVYPHNWDGIPDASVEYMISGSCLEHVEAPWLWAKEAERKLKSGGILIVFCPFYMREHRYPVDCWRILPDGYKYLFCKWCGLQCLECGITPNNEDTFFVGRK
jgi:hypothetical protein